MEPPVDPLIPLIVLAGMALLVWLRDRIDRRAADLRRDAAHAEAMGQFAQSMAKLGEVVVQANVDNAKHQNEMLATLVETFMPEPPPPVAVDNFDEEGRPLTERAGDALQSVLDETDWTEDWITPRAGPMMRDWREGEEPA